MRQLMKNEGFTLIELMVTLGLLALVIMGGFRLYYFSNNAYVTGAISADIQADVQLAMQRITSELRLAHRVSLGEPLSAPTGPDLEEHRLFLNSDQLVVLQTPEGTQTLTPYSPGDFGYELSFAKDPEAPNALQIELKSSNPNVPYSLSSEVEVLNVRLEGVQGAAWSDTIYFTKKLSKEEQEAARDIRRGCLLTDILGDGDNDLDIFRRFRDERLAKNGLGQLIIRWYYRASITLADSLSNSKALSYITWSFAKMLAIGLAWASWLEIMGIIFTLSLISSLGTKFIKRCLAVQSAGVSG